MAQNSVDYYKLLLLLIGFPVGRSVQILAEHLLLEPYPREAWGSWLLVGWAIALLITVIQFALGTAVHSERLGSSFLLFGIPTILYSFILLSLVNAMFPKPPDDPPPAFLLAHFQQGYRYDYLCGFALALIPFIIGRAAFGDALISVPQISRIIWMVCFTVGFFVPPTYLVVHEIIWVVAFPLLLTLFAVYSNYKPKERRAEAS
jgi:hypothetical protein